jgi:hypothetical protein
MRSAVCTQGSDILVLRWPNIIRDKDETGNSLDPEEPVLITVEEREN